jgi:tryptophan halogenase
MKFCIVGGGTAGWLTALYVKSLFKNSNVTLVESDEIGIIGAGEGSTAGIIPFLQDLDIDPLEVIRKVKGTLKLGIKFENWNGDNESYYHPFGPYLGRDDLDISPLGFSHKNTRSINYNDEGRYYLASAIVNDIDFNKIIINNMLCDEMKSNMLKEQAQSLNSFHFDARELALFLRNIAEKRGIVRKEGKILEIKNDEEGNVVSLTTDRESIEGDFFFDCSGFKRILIGNFYHTPWVSYSKHLKVKAALPFFLDSEEKIFPYTRSIAMKYGWMWQIPLQHRIGAGYIFDTDFISEGDALSEAEEFLGRKINPGKLIKFDAGRYEKFWVKNCIAIGLSGGFTEPIEATSIMLTTIHLSLLNSYHGGIFSKNPKIISEYNEALSEINDHVMHFLSFHYLTQRNDTEFWRSHLDREFLPDRVKEMLEIWKDQIPTSLDSRSPWDQFTADNYLLVGHGLKVFDGFVDNWKENLQKMGSQNDKLFWIKIYNKLKDSCIRSSDHTSFIKRFTND